MASLRTFTLPHYAAYPVHVALFHNVQNPAFLKSQLLAGNPDFDYAFLDAAMILSPAHLLTAIFHTLHALSTNRPKTRSPHSELVFRLSPNNNIAQSYTLFGITDTTTALVVVKLACRLAPSTSSRPTKDVGVHVHVDDRVTAHGVSEHLGHVVQGTSVVLGEAGDELGQACDVARVQKVYKLGDVGANKGAGAGKKEKTTRDGSGAQGQQQVEMGRDQRKELESVILGMLSLKGS